MSLKAQIRHFWDSSPCGTKDVFRAPEGSEEFYAQLERNRYTNDDFMFEVVQFNRWKGKKILEVGCGPGVDLVQFARSGAKITGIDLSFQSAVLARKWLQMEGLSDRILQGDAENLPFKDNQFDLVYSWGVLHHTPDIHKAIREIVRVCKKGGHVQVMLYHLHSLVALQVWLRWGVLSGKPLAEPRHLIKQHMESPGTQSFSRKEALELFRELTDVSVQPILTCYDLRISRRRFLPAFLRRLLPPELGWFLYVRSRKR